MDVRESAGERRLSWLIDSVIVIDHLSGSKRATEYLRSVQAESAVSVITRAEVLVGYESSASAGPARALLDRFPTLGLDRDVADLCVELRRQHGWKLPDAFQAAAARYHGLALVTRNVRDFPPDRHEFVVVPYGRDAG